MAAANGRLHASVASVLEPSPHTTHRECSAGRLVKAGRWAARLVKEAANACQG